MAVALGARGLRENLPVWVLVVAAYAVDLVEITAGILGVAPEEPVVTSVVVTAGLALGFGALHRIPNPADRVGAWVVGLVALSHVALDWVDDRAALWPGGPVGGLELRERPGVEFAVEAAMVTIGWWLWRGSLPEERRRSIVAWGVPIALVAAQAAFHLRERWLPGA